MTYRRKLIEVAMPLYAINAASAREKSIRHGHPSTLHLWWSRKPLATCRAVLFGQMVDDPSSLEDEFPAKEAQDAERQRLFRIIEELVKWESTTNDTVLHAARTEIARSVARQAGIPFPGPAQPETRNQKPETPTPSQVQTILDQHAPPVLDPFCGGGSIPLEAQRLGLRAIAGDLNPVAVLITKALIEIPPKFANQPPINPEDQQHMGGDAAWRGATGLAADVRYYGRWMREEASKRIGHLYPRVELSAGKGDSPGGEATVIAWLWARTVTCPNPACGAAMPLTSKWWLSSKKGREVWVEPIVDRSPSRERRTNVGAGLAPTHETDRASMSGPACRDSLSQAFGQGQAQPLQEFQFGAPVQEQLPDPAMAGDVQARLPSGRTSPEIHFEIRHGTGAPEGTVNRQGARCLACGTAVPFDHVRSEGRAGRMGRELMAVVAEGSRGRTYLAPSQAAVDVANTAEPVDAPAAILPHNPRDFKTPNYGMKAFADLFTPRQLMALTTFSDLVTEARERVLADGGNEARANAVATYLALAVDRLADRNSAICSWDATRDNVRNTFARQAIPMVWDYAEANVFSGSTGNFGGALEWVAEVVGAMPASAPGNAYQMDAAVTAQVGMAPIISTDPPYYDNIGYADLSDFFYVWLRRSLQTVYPDLFRTLLTPKQEELVATPYRFDGNKQRAEQFFRDGLQQAFGKAAAEEATGYPMTVYYAYKQAETPADGNGTASTGWDTMLEGLIKGGFAITGTWPMRTEMSNRPVASGTNALASSVVLTCRVREATATIATRREFIAALHDRLAAALTVLRSGNIAPVDLAQASIGPGMAIFTRYARVLEPDGSPMSVRSALGLINTELASVLAEQEGAVDPYTRFCIHWFEQYGLSPGVYGHAETMAMAQNISVDGLRLAGVLDSTSERGKARLLRRDELDPNWDPVTDKHLTDWICAQHLSLAIPRGPGDAARLARRMGADKAQTAHDLAYLLFSIADRKGWTDEAFAYNLLVTSWPDVQRLMDEGEQAAFPV